MDVAVALTANAIGAVEEWREAEAVTKSAHGDSSVEYLRLMRFMCVTGGMRRDRTDPLFLKACRITLDSRKADPSSTKSELLSFI